MLCTPLASEARTHCCDSQHLVPGYVESVADMKSSLVLRTEEGGKEAVVYRRETSVGGKMTIQRLQHQQQ